MPAVEPEIPTPVRLKNHLRRRFLLGIIVFAPFGVTFWILLKFIDFSKAMLIRPIVSVLEWVLESHSPELLGAIKNANTDDFVWWVQYPALAVSIILALVLLYLVGVISATILGRRYIAAGERLLQRIPGAQFCYNTIKQVIEIVSRPRSEAFQKVVLIEYPRKGIRGLAFFSGITVVPATGEAMVNVFIPTTPNPTSGFLLLMRADEVLETNLTMAEATRFIISGGVVAMENLQLRPFPIEEYAEEIGQRRRAALAGETKASRETETSEGPEPGAAPAPERTGS